MIFESAVGVMHPFINNNPVSSGNLRTTGVTGNCAGGDNVVGVRLATQSGRGVPLRGLSLFELLP